MYTPTASTATTVATLMKSLSAGALNVAGSCFAAFFTNMG